MVLGITKKAAGGNGARQGILHDQDNLLCNRGHQEESGKRNAIFAKSASFTKGHKGLEKLLLNE